MSVWTPDSFRLFLCHVSAHKETAEALKAALSIYNVSCFVAHSDIEPTREWQEEIEEALRSMDALAALLTYDFHASNWTDQEVGFAMGRDVLILSLRYGQDPYGFIGKYQGYPISEKKMYTDIAKDIVSILAKNDTTSLRIAEVLVQRLELSGTFESSKSTMTMLEECAQLDSDLLERLENVLTENSQVGGAWGVPDRIRALMLKFKIKETI
jgi:hypothetical protein